MSKKVQGTSKGKKEEKGFRDDIHKITRQRPEPCGAPCSTKVNKNKILLKEDC